MKKLIVASAVVASLAMASGAFAADGFYMSAGIGGRVNHDSSSMNWVSVGDGGSHANHFNQNNHKGDFIGNIALGYQFNDQFRMELAYTDSFGSNKVISNHYYDEQLGSDSAVRGSETIENKYRVHPIMLNGYFSFPNALGSFTPFITAGIGYAHLSVDSYQATEGHDYNPADATHDIDTYTGHSSLSGSKNNFAWNVGLGATTSLADNLNLDITFRYADFGKVNFYGTAHSDSTGGPSGDLHDNFNADGNARLRAFDGLVNLRYTF